MFLADGWKDYEVLDAGDGYKIERWGEVILKRPDPQAVWPMSSLGEGIVPHATYIRSSTGGGRWEFNEEHERGKNRVPESWRISYRELTFIVRPTGFKHTGLFPEQAVNWDALTGIVSDWSRRQSRPFEALNLFAYTGGATVALAAAGANVVHVDAAKGIVAWAKENLAASNLADRQVRFIVDDCLKFVLREQRRGRFYDGIIMDPPSYGRGPDGQMWKIDEHLFRLVSEAVKLLSRQARFFFINSYTTGLAPSVIKNVLIRALNSPNGFNGAESHITAEELALPITGTGFDAKSPTALTLPCGATGRWTRL